MATGEELDMVAMTEALTAELMSYAMLMTLISGIVVLLVFGIVFLIRKKNFLKEVCVRSIPVKGILPIAILAVGFNVITSVVITYVPWPQEWIDAYAANSAAIDGSLISWITAVIMAPLLEEVVFRGLMYTRLKKGLPVIVAAIITSLAFGIMQGAKEYTLSTTGIFQIPRLIPY